MRVFALIEVDLLERRVGVLRLVQEQEVAGTRGLAYRYDNADERQRRLNEMHTRWSGPFKGPTGAASLRPAQSADRCSAQFVE